MWAKTHEAFKYIYENHFDDADWFMKADDDTFVVLENLRYLLYQYSSDFPVYFGQVLKESVSTKINTQKTLFSNFKIKLYMAGGSGYVLSKESLQRFYKKGVLENKCPIDENNEDLMLGFCMKKLKVIAGDSRDNLMRERFFQFQPDIALPDHPKDPGFWYHTYTWFQLRYGQKRCCSDTLVSTHYVTPQEMYLYEYLIYKVQVNGFESIYDEQLPKKISHAEFWKNVDDGKIENKFQNV